MIITQKQVTDKPDATILTCSGKLARDGGDNKLRLLIIELNTRGVKNIIINASDIVYVDTAGLGALIQTYVNVKRVFGKLIFSEPSDRVQSLFKRTKCERLFTVAANDTEAVKMISV